MRAGPGRLDERPQARDVATVTPLLVLPILVVVLAHNPSHGSVHHKKGQHAAPVTEKLGPSLTQERILRRRVARLARLALLERRKALLQEFVVRAATETPAFRDDRVTEVGPGIIVGPATVTIDFLGSPVIRVRVRNASTVVATPLLVARLRAADGSEASAALAVRPLGPGESRVLEAACPRSLTPVSVRWEALTP